MPPHLDGQFLSLAWSIPFIGILLSISLCPLLTPIFWHNHYGKITLLWTLLFLVPFSVCYGVSLAAFEICHVTLIDYFPFVVLMTSLYTVAGGIRITGKLIGTPRVNTFILGLGTLLAGFMGTTGASMLLIRPLLRANQNRQKNAHVVVFFIFLVANIGGSLTPLGDPPLFLGFLHGVDFFWTLPHLGPLMLFTSGLLLLLFYIIDSILYRQDQKNTRGLCVENVAQNRLGVEGAINLVFLIIIVLCIFISGVWKTNIFWTLYHVPVTFESLLCNFALVVIVFLSLSFTDSQSREDNGFTWKPIIEVSKLFLGIFITIIPAIAILRSGADGALNTVLSMITDAQGRSIPAMYFWVSGVLSSVLDNAPTYLVFFNIAGGNADDLTRNMPSVLLAISAGSVFMGANTYIGNAPNFMVKAIAEEQDIEMPSFFGYMLWSTSILIPLFALVTLFFF
ncbi:Sodium:proton antiporter [Azospirillaceae bacterium]